MTKRSLVGLLTLPLVLTACFGKGTVKRDSVIGREVLTTTMPSGGPIEHPLHGTEVWFAVGAINGEKKTKANGVAQAHLFEDKQSIVDIRVNIAKAPVGKKYVAWLETPDATSKIRIGVLASILGDVRHAVNETVKGDVQNSTKVVVTLEDNKGPKPTDAIMATGTLKERER